MISNDININKLNIHLSHQSIEQKTDHDMAVEIQVLLWDGHKSLTVKLLIPVTPISDGYGVECHFQKYFSYIVAVSFIDGGNLSTQRKPSTCRKSLTNYHIMLYRVHLAMNSIPLSDNWISNDNTNITTVNKICRFVPLKTTQTLMAT